MKFQKLFFILLVSVLFIGFSSCSDDDSINTPDIPSDEILNVEFAKGLAIALKDAEIRTFIKEEALKEIDNDYDVIYALVKNRKLKNGKTFREALSIYMGGIKKLDSITQLDQTLTILVPFLGDNIFNAEAWDTETTIPVVTYRDQFINKRQNKLLTFDSQGNSFYLDRYIIPETAALVIKSNERLVNPQKAHIKSSNKNLELLSDEGELVAYYIDDAFSNNTPHLSKTITTVMNKLVIFDDVTPMLTDNIYYQSLINTPESPRDYIYYNISTKNNIDKGQLNTNYKEFITSIKFNSKETLSHIEDWSDASVTADWSDGNLEIVFDFLFLTKEEVLSKITKMISIKTSELFNSKETITYNIPNPIEVFNWDMYKYGNTFKVILSEYDSGNQTEINNSISTTFGHNWEVSTSGGFGSIWKVNAKYSGSYTEQKQASTKINSTNNSDPLGEIFVDFFNPILLNNKPLITARILRKNGSDPAPISKNFDLSKPELIKGWMDEVVSSMRQKYPTATLRIYFEFDTDRTFYQSNTGMVSLSIVPQKIN